MADVDLAGGWRRRIWFVSLFSLFTLPQEISRGSSLFFSSSFFSVLESRVSGRGVSASVSGRWRSYR